MKFLKRVFFIILLLIALLLVVIWLYLKNQSPQYSGDQTLEGLNQKVEVVFDEYGIPHIYAENEQDAYFALGYVQAQDRLFQMVLYKKLVQGKASEILGSELIPTDKYFLTLGLDQVAKKAADRHFNSAKKEKYQEPALAYLEGINASIEEGNLPVEFDLIGFKPERFTPTDIYGSINLTALGFSFAQREDLILNYIYNDLGEEYFQDWSEDFQNKPDSSSQAVALLMGEKLDAAMKSIGLPLWEGSNAWVLGPSKTKSGKAILANDTHIGFSQPQVWYEAYIQYPGYEFYGSFLPTCPFGVLGHNENLAWGLTIFPFDNMDYYELENIGDPNSYLFFGDTLNYELQSMKIQVKDEDPVVFKRQMTEFGPVINSIDAYVDSVYQNPLALAWSVYHLEQSSLDALYLLNHAQNIQEFQSALPLIDIVGLNVMYADQEDNIAWWACGKIPLRDSLTQSFKFLKSNHLPDRQFGFQSFNQNPFLINPSNGFIATANNNPVLSGSHFERGNYLPSDRIERIKAILSKENDWDIDKCKTVQLDQISEKKAELAHFIADHFIDVPSEGMYQEAAKILSQWDGDYGLESIAPTIFSRLYYHIAHQAFGDELGPELFEKTLSSYLLKKTLPKVIYHEDSPWWQKTDSETLNTRDQILTLAFFMTVDELKRELGPKIQNWKWENVHTLTHEHPIGSKKPLDKIFNVGPFPVAGGNQVLNKMEYNLSDDLIHEVGSGPALRILIDFANVEDGLNISPTGQSGNFRSPHYDDQALMFVNGEYRKMIINRDELLKGKNQILRLLPQ